jgi:hypothetical protein
MFEQNGIYTGKCDFLSFSPPGFLEIGEEKTD